MCSSEMPLVVFLTYLPSIAAGIFFSFFLLLENRKNGIVVSVATMLLVFALWASINFLTWLPVSFSQFVWLQKFSLLFVLTFPFFIYFAYYLTGFPIKPIIHFIIHLPIFPVIILPFTRWSQLLYTVVQEGSICRVEEGPFYRYLLLLNIFYLVWVVYVLIKRYRIPGTGKNTRHKMHFVMLAVLFFFVWVNAFEETRHLTTYYLRSFVPVGMFFFIGILLYTIGKYHLFNIRIVSAKFSVIMIWFLLAVQFSLRKFGTGSKHAGVTLALAILFGIFLVRSITFDVTRNEQLEKIAKKLTKVNLRLRQIDKDKSDFIGIVSHRLRTPVTSIKGYASLMLEGLYGQFNPRQTETLKKVFVLGERLAWIIEDILDVSHIETGKMKFNFSRCQLEKIVQNAIDIIAPRAKEKNLYLKYYKLSEIPELLIDGPKIQEVVSNFLDNAAKYTETGGINVSLENLGGIVRLTVTDTGMGISNEEIPYLFTRFSRGSNTETAAREGMGLGLYVGKRIVEANGGKVWVKSLGKEKGSQFALELPVEPDKKILDQYQKNLAQSKV